MAGFKSIAFVTLSCVLFECCINEVATNINAGTCRVIPIKVQPSVTNKKPDKIYRAFQTKEVTWRQAWQECNSRKMSLLTFESTELDKELAALLKTGFYWTSGRRFGNDWFWVTTTVFGNATITPISYTNWAQGEPDDRGGVEEDCMTLDMDLKVGWHNYPCSEKAFSICERYS